jgi:hypothetical protein
MAEYAEAIPPYEDTTYELRRNPTYELHKSAAYY